MGLNKQKGNMYGFVTHTWNPIKGRCIHNCNYCYMHNKWKLMKNDNLRLDSKEFREFERDMVKYGDSGHFIFIGSSTDIWAENVEKGWIMAVLNTIERYPGNTYLFQTKNPKGFAGWNFISGNNKIILGITLETYYRINEYSIADTPTKRAQDFYMIQHSRKMVTIEPIMDFGSPKYFADMIKALAPEWVNIGADTGGNKLPEPSKDKILDLISELKKFTEVKNKSNLKRLLK